MKPIVVTGLILILCNIAIGVYGKRRRQGISYHSFPDYRKQYHSELKIWGLDSLGSRRKSTRYNKTPYGLRPPRWDLQDKSESDSSSDSRSDSGPDSRSDNGADNNKEVSYWDSGEEREPDSGEDEGPDEIDFASSNEGHGPRPCFGSRCPPPNYICPWLKSTTVRPTAPWLTRPTKPTRPRPKLWPTKPSNPIPWWPKPTKTTPNQRPSRLDRPTTIRGTTEWWQTTTSKWPNTRPTPRPKLRLTTSCRKTQSPTTRKPRTTRTILTDWTATTTTSTQEMNPTTITSPEETTILEAILDCLDKCVSSQEYNPVCGTDGVTYDNIGYLICAKNCGVNVELQQNSVCSFTPLSRPDEVELNGNEGDGGSISSIFPGSATEPQILGRTTSMTISQHHCMKQCNLNPSFSPVCGTDFVTYMNIDRLNCAKRCGEDIELLCEQPCAACDLGTQIMNTTIKPTVLTTTSGDVDRATSTTSKEQCIRACPVTPEYNPVCGSNGVTYANPGHLLCAQLCGEAVKIRRFTPCQTIMTTDSPTSMPDDDYSKTSLEPAIEACIRRCPVTSEYNPVCGTNGWTYENSGRLWCAKDCGVNVNIRSNGPCNFNPTSTSTVAGFPLTSISRNKDTILTTLWTPERPSTKPTSWTTSTTSSWISSTTSSWNLTSITARSTITTPSWASSTTLKSTTPTLSLTTSQPPFTSPTTSGSTSFTLGFTIPPDLLSSIFGDLTTTSTTQPTVPIYTDYAIDPRFGDDAEEKTHNQKNEPNRIVFPD